MNTANYPSSLTDRQWELISQLIPIDFPHFKTVYGVFRHWKLEGIWERMNTELRRMVRQRAGKNPEPAAAILDSQSAKSAPHGGQVGYDAEKRIKGRKRHILVDTLGLLLGIDVTEADFPEREGGFWLFNRLKGVLRGLRRVWADSGYSGEDFARRVRLEMPALHVETVNRGLKTKGFQVLPHRWIVERTFAWFMRSRRLCRDYETTTSSSEALAFISMIDLQLHRLVK